MGKQKSSALSNWILASRPRTLPAAIGPAIVGNALAFHDGKYDLGLGIACIIISVMMQVIANLANDLFDFQKGSDNKDRLGPTRATASGLISVKKMRIGIIILIGITALIGGYIALSRGIVVIGLGVLIFLGALLYSGGIIAYGYRGLGDLFVFIFFGLVATMGTYFAITGTVSLIAGIFSLTQGFLITNILVVNNVRDRFTDEQSGKRTLAVMFGRNVMNTEFVVNLLIPFGLIIFVVLRGLFGYGIFTVLFSLPLARTLYLDFLAKDGKDLNAVLGATANFSLVFSILLCLGILVGK
jgi:1,4-dihydroxy-2-naphthoate octaprenyltransferase